jgi:hypothetical protein
LIRLSTQLAKQRRGPGLTGEEVRFDPNNTVRIALLHHHPVVTLEAEQDQLRRTQGHWSRWLTDPTGAYRDAKMSATASATKLEGADEFLFGCFKAGIQLVLFGHDHHAYRRAVVWEEEKGVTGSFGETKSFRAFCCPTTLESEAENGFYVFDFLDKNTVSIDFYLSRQSDDNVQLPFSRIIDESGERKLSELSPKELSSKYTLKRSPAIDALALACEEGSETAIKSEQELGLPSPAA